MNTLCIILARAGSKGLPRKNVLPLAGKPMIAWTIDHAQGSRRVDRIVLSTDGDEIAQVGRDHSIEVIERPADLAGDMATVDSAARHAVLAAEAQAGVRCDAVVILYGNVPLRPADLTDCALAKLAETGCDSVQSVCPVGKMHPYWMKRIGGDTGDTLLMYQDNAIYRRQELPPVYMLDGGVIVVTRASLFTVVEGEPHGFLGRDRRAVVTQPGEVMDIDSPLDLIVAEALMRSDPLSPWERAGVRGPWNEKVLG
ncbi:MAG: acylneuraminate cytidylyltransferase family protein [Phycisphaeraceae bacterium]